MKKVNGFLIILYAYFISLLLEVTALAYYMVKESTVTIALSIAGAVLVLAIMIVLFVLLIVNIYQGFQSHRAEDRPLLRSAMKRIKLGSIPFFILNFLLCLGVGFVILGASRGFAVFLPWVWLWVMCAVGITYCLAAGTSCYGIFFSRTLNKDGDLSTGSMVKHIILQLIFVADIIDTILLLKKFRRVDNEKE